MPSAAGLTTNGHRKSGRVEMEVDPDSPGPAAAVAAWRTLDAGANKPAGVWQLGSKYKKRIVYRLVRAGPGGATIIAKLCPEPAAARERLVYEQILPHVPVTSPRYFGWLDASDGATWLFLEDVGSELFSRTDNELRRVAAEWLGILHDAAADLPAVRELPDRGPGYYLERLRSARQTILDSIGNPLLRASDIDVLHAVLGLLDVIEADWAAVEAFCSAMPCTLTHGDFQPKNVFVRRDGSGTRIYPIDWEMAGRGVPAPDVAPARGRVSQPDIDLALYRGVVQRRWPGVDRRAIRGWVAVGTLFRRLIAIDWSAPSLRSAWPERPIAQLSVYLPQLKETLAVAPWAPHTKRDAG